MSMTEDIDHSTLNWVKGELDETLKQAGQALESFTKDPNDLTQMRFCATYLHQVYAILQMLELYGAGMLAEEMENTSRVLLDGKIAKKDEAYEILMASILQLSDYLEKIQGGHRDIPILILPLMNDLRAIRGENLLSENAFFSPAIDMDGITPFYMCPGEGNLDEIAKKVRHTFQVGLLGVIRGKDLEKSLKSLLLVLKKLAYAASNDKLGLLWWVSAGFVQTILGGGLKQSTTIKMLLGHIDRQLKAVIENGEQILQQEPPKDLIKNLLFYIGRTEVNLPIIVEIQERFDLKTLLMAENEVSEARDGISAPTNEMLETVSAAIKDDLDAVKEGLDLFLRNRQSDPSKIEGLEEILNRTGDTMGMIGLGQQRNIAKEKAAVIGKIASGELKVSEQELMDLAGDLLFIEYALNNLSAKTSSGLAHVEDSEAIMPDYEYELVFISTLEEVINDIALVKEAVVNFVGTKDHSKLDGVPELFSRITGALQVIELGKCSSLLDLAGQYISQELHFKKVIPSEDAIDKLADAISSIEYYLEGYVDKSGVREEVLDLAISSLKDLGYSYIDQNVADHSIPGDQELPKEAEIFGFESDDLHEEFIQPEVETAEEHSSENIDEFIDIREDFVEPLANEESLANEEPSANEEPAVEVDEFIEIREEESQAESDFIDFGEELEIPGDISLESEETVSESEPEKESLEEIPEFLEFAAEDEAGEIGAEEQVAEDEFIDFGAEPEQEQEEIVESQEEVKETGAIAAAKLLEELPVLSEDSDPEILEIFLEEAQELYEDLQQSMPKWLEDTKNTEQLGDIRRTYHTYKGSGRLAGAPLIGEFAWHIEKLLNQVLEDNIELSDRVCDVLQEAMSVLPALIARLNGEEADILSVYHLAWKADVLADPARHAELDQTVEEGSVPVVEQPVEEIPEKVFEAESSEEEAGEEPSAEIEEPSAEIEEPSAEIEEPSSEIELLSEEEVPEEESQEEATEETLAEEQEEIRRDAEGNILVPRMDPTLYTIFSNEVADHLQVIKDCVSKTDGEILVTEEMVRAMHTLAGSARMAAAEEVAEAGGALDKFIHKLQEQQTALCQDDIQILEEGVSYVEKLIDAVGDDRKEMPDGKDYLQKLDELLHGFDAESAMDQPKPEAIAADVDPDLVQLFVEEADDILAFLETTVHIWESAPYDGSVVAELHRSLHTLKGGARLAKFDGIGTLSHILETISIDIAEKRIAATHQTFEIIHQAFDRLVNMVAMAKDGLNAPLPEDIVVRLENLSETGEAKVVEEVVVQPEQQDMELVEVFLEEGDEILAAGQGVLQRWIETPDNIDLIVEMQRALHTLKGGARMAGFWAIGNLGHALETLLIEVLEGRLSTSPEFFDVLENSYDRLGDMLNNAKAGKSVDEAEDILNMLEAVKKGEKVDIPLQQQKSAVEAAITQALEEPSEKVQEPTEEVQPKPVAHSEVVRVKADLLDDLVNYAGEISIYRARTEQQVSGFRSHLEEMDQTVVRLREQLRKLEIETEAQILFRHERESESVSTEDFDPLELDRFSQIQQVSRAIAETLNDINSISDFMDLLARDAETLLLQQSRVNTELQEGLVHSRMVPFSNMVPRMRRVVRQTCQELKKEAQIKIIGAQGEMDRTVLERITAPLEHMLRNAIAHGVEDPDTRVKSNKDRSGTLSVTLTREGPDIVIKVADDGGGINYEAIRAKALTLGWMKEDDYLSDSEVAQFILETGFSTAEAVTQIAGRGVGMDVVNNEIKQLGGTLNIQSEQGKGTEFTIRLPFTLAINHALLVNAADETYAIPLSSIDGVVRLTHEQLKEFYSDKGASSYEYAGQFYQVINMAALLGIGTPLLPGVGKRAPVVLVQTGEHRFALQVDGLLGSREIVVKALGPQISSIPGVMGATILGNGSVVLILDIGSLSRISLSGGIESLKEVKESEDEITRFTAMVVDDSITVRRVGARLLERNGFDVLTAKDGVDAITVLQERVPDIMLLDIEMPRMDGFELATHMKNDDRLKDIPIIMITSRTGEKHRERAKRIGVEHYLGKPYQENELLQKILELLRITPHEAK